MGEPRSRQQGLYREPDGAQIVDFLTDHYLPYDSSVVHSESAINAHARFHHVVEEGRVAHVIVGIQVLEAFSNFDVENGHQSRVSLR